VRKVPSAIDSADPSAKMIAIGQSSHINF
jgi:hypothetical protein